MPEHYIPPVAPVQIERRLISLMRANAAAFQALLKAEKEYAELKTPLAVARARARFEAKGLATKDDKWNEGDREAYVLQQTEELQLQFDVAELHMRSAKARVAWIANELEIVRSLSASVRNSLQMGG